MENIHSKNKFELRYNLIAPEIIEKLQALKRTGWVNRGVSNPESVQEHTIALRNLVISEISLLVEFSAEEKTEILDMLEIHDWPESDPKVGDRVVLKTDKNREQLKNEKYEAELEAMTKICEKLGNSGKKILELWIKFENNKEATSVFAHQVDKLQAMEKAFEYQQAGENVLTQEFIEHDEGNIIHPVLVKRLQALKEKLKSLQ